MADAGGHLLIGCIRQLQSETFVVGESCAAYDEAVGPHTGPFDHQVQRVGKVAVAHNLALDVFGDTEAVFVLVGIVSASKIGGSHVIFIIRQVGDTTVRLTDALQGKTVGLDEVCFVGRDIADDQLGPVDDHLVVEMLEGLMEIGECDFGLHAAGGLYEQLVAPDGLLAEEDFLREVSVLGCVVVVGDIRISRATGFAREGVFGGGSAVVVV